ncbi:MAG: M23 family metallopeptidase [Bacteroidota bacterium]
MRFCLLLFLSFLLFSASESPKYPTDYFRAPVEHPVLLSGTFGELRSTHFHAGIDIKSSKGRTGDALVAAAEGYVSRIKVQAGGYGNALYIKHPNGYTTVYAHLLEFAPAIASYVKSKQYEQQSFSVDLFPQAEQFSFQKGERIGKMGNTGSSGGPHLHFEIRDSRTEKPINPLLFGIKVKDTRRPMMNQVRIFGLNHQRESIGAKSYDLIASGKHHKVRGDTIYTPSKEVGVALKTYDQFDGASNWNGVYQVSMLQEEDLRFRFKMETFSFDERRYINAHLDYEDRVTKKSYFNRCYLLPGNEMSIYEEVKKEGVVRLQDEASTKITLLSEDIAGNLSKAIFWLKYRPKADAPPKKFNYFLPYSDENAIDNGQLYVYFPKGSFYENLYLNYQMTLEDSDNIHSAVHQIHDYRTPVHRSFDIAIRPTKLAASMKNKAFVAYCDKDGDITNVGYEWKNERLWAKARTLGDYYIMIDTIPPSIRPNNFSNNMRGKSQMSFKIWDNFGTGGTAKSLQYQAFVDGQWILMEHDAKTQRIIHRFDERIGKGEHQLRIEVSDALGNQSVLERKFVR